MRGFLGENYHLPKATEARYILVTNRHFWKTLFTLLKSIGNFFVLLDLLKIISNS